MPGHAATVRSIEEAVINASRPIDTLADMRTAVVRVRVDPAGQLDRRRVSRRHE